jgi:hypothetical protein
MDLTQLLEGIRQRQQTDPARKVQPRLVHFAGDYGLEGVAEPDRLVSLGGLLKKAVTLTQGSCMDFECVLTSTRPDRHGDVLESAGAIVDPKMPLLLQHNPDWNIGKLLEVTKQSKRQVKVKNSIADTTMGRDAAQLVEFGSLRISHGFFPEEWEVRKDPKNPERPIGYHITKFRVVEVSLVSVPANEDAVITAYSRNKFCDPRVKAWAKGLFDKRQVLVPGFAASTNGHHRLAALERITKHALVRREPEADPIRWNRRLSKEFDVASAPLEPCSLTCDWVSQYLSQPIKRVYQVGSFIPSVRMGSFLTGLRNVLAAAYKLEDTRNIVGSSEAPPSYEAIQLNSNLSDTFLVNGTSFYKGQTHNVVADLNAHWYGLDLTLFAPLEHRDATNQIINDAWRWAKENNFLKGEAFALSGEFLDKTGEEWSDLFLPAVNEKSLKRVLDRLNSKEKQFRNHGMILTGPPGTGKTLSGRILRNQAKATFIWVSARDFYRAGAFGGLSMAFDMAKELSPSIVFIEDVDNWLDNYAVDYLKTEMDGISRSSGLLTILTTNYPEMLPEALIDRPGRFHDVLHFNLPEPSERGAMLSRWLPDLGRAELSKAVEATDGYSGAHLYHLAEFAKSLRESEEIELADAVALAIQKVAEQRDLINGIQLQGSRYKPTREAQLAIKSLSGGSHKLAIPRAQIPTTDTEQKAQALLASLYAGDAPAWHTLHALKEQVHRTIERAELAALEKIGA